MTSLSNKLNSVEWGEFRLGSLFEVRKGKRLPERVLIETQGNIALINQSSQNNMVARYSGIQGSNEIYEKNAITFAVNTKALGYQSNNFYTIADVLFLKSSFLNQRNANFFIASIKKQLPPDGWDKIFGLSQMKDLFIQLPTKNNEIDLDFIESFMAKLEEEKISELKAYLKVTSLKDYNLTNEEQKVLDEFDSIEWDEFKLENLFERIKTNKLPFKASELSKEPIDNYTLPCLTSSFQNQGLNYFAPKDNATILKNVISIPSNSDIYRAYFQSKEFTVLSDAYAIEWICDDVKLSQNQYLFTVPCINKVTDLSIYSYKNKLGGWNVVKNKYIKLPIKDNQPDYKTMEILISAIKKLVIKDVVLYADEKTSTTKNIVDKEI